MHLNRAVDVFLSGNVAGHLRHVLYAEFHVREGCEDVASDKLRLFDHAFGAAAARSLTRLA